MDEFNSHLGVITRNTHFRARWKRDLTSHISRTEIELRTVVREERLMTTAFFLGQNIGLSLELGMRSNGTRLRENLTTLNFFLLRSTKKRTNVVSSTTLIKELAEHFNTSTRRLLRRLNTNDFDFITSVHNALFHTTSHNRATTSDREHIFNRHKERLVSVTLRLRNELINSSHQLKNLSSRCRITLKGLQSRNLDNRNIVTRELIFIKKLTNLKLHKIKKFLIIDHVDLIQSNNQRRHTNLTSKQHMLTSLRHRTISSRHNQNRAVNLSSTSDHVLDVISMSRHINMRVMTIRSLILNM
ncbi:unannotated protein [freshwater metagenome]|uniref:Unannotated protein n=1 Tax=freshwater metagenome TaxID=449393 RepID=A0A6J6X284_9ZZZZ